MNAYFSCIYQIYFKVYKFLNVWEVRFKFQSEMGALLSSITLYHLLIRVGQVIVLRSCTKLNCLATAVQEHVLNVKGILNSAATAIKKELKSNVILLFDR